MRFSNSEARELAIGLAKSFLESQPTRSGWKWKVVDTTPDLQAPHARDRKTVNAWAVIVEWSLNGSMCEGPAILRVNVATKEVST